MPFHEYLYLFLFTLAAVGAQISLIVALYHFTSPLQSAITLLPRNLLLIIWATLGRGGLVLRSNWLQMVVVLAGGTVATLATDDELSSCVERVATRVGVRKGESWAKDQHLPSASPHEHSVRSPPSRKLILLPFLPLLIYFFQSSSTTTSLAAACSYLPTNVRSTLCHTFTAPTSRTVDLVVAYYDEDLALARHHIQNMRERAFVRERNSRVLIYNKGPRSEEELREKMELRSGDEVIPLDNYGREGATYLKVSSYFPANPPSHPSALVANPRTRAAPSSPQHILLHYNSSIAALATALDPYSALTFDASPSQEGLHRSRVLADHTYFLQPHLAWEGVASPRIDLVGPDTGFAHFGPMMRNVSGIARFGTCAKGKTPS